MGAAKLGAFGGTFLGGALMLHYGRRPAIGLDAAFFMLGPLLMAASEGPTCAESPTPHHPTSRRVHSIGFRGLMRRMRHPWEGLVRLRGATAWGLEN